MDEEKIKRWERDEEMRLLISDGLVGTDWTYRQRSKVQRACPDHAFPLVRWHSRPRGDPNFVDAALREQLHVRHNAWLDAAASSCVRGA